MFRSGGGFRFVAIGYAGAKGSVNNPNASHIRATGPLPKGKYRLVERTHDRFKAPAFFLSPHPDNEMFGRAGFWIHGDNIKGDRSASTGCIVLGWHDRSFVKRLIARDGGFATLEVI